MGLSDGISITVTLCFGLFQAYDLVPREFSTVTVKKETPANDMEKMKNSEIFKQAWWVEGDPAEFKPASYLTLTEEYDQAIVEWPPINATLNQFLGSYEQSVDIIQKVIITSFSEAIV